MGLLLLILIKLTGSGAFEAKCQKRHFENGVANHKETLSCLARQQNKEKHGAEKSSGKVVPAKRVHIP